MEKSSRTIMAIRHEIIHSCFLESLSVKDTYIFLAERLGMSITYNQVRNTYAEIKNQPVENSKEPTDARLWTLLAKGIISQVHEYNNKLDPTNRYFPTSLAHSVNNEDLS